MKVSLIIPTYKDTVALKLILDALEFQTYKNFEILISEDDDSIETKLLLKNYKSSYEITHYSHENIGNRKPKAVNNCIVLSKGDYIILIDGDTIPFTTFSRFFEWFREVSDIENAQSAQLVQQILAKSQTATESDKSQHFIEQRLLQAHSEMHAPALAALRHAIRIVLPEISNVWLQYHPKLQFMVNYDGQIMMFQQLSNSIRNLVALIGDIVRRLCLLNPASLYPCDEGDGV